MDSSDEEWIVLDACNPADSSDDDHGVLDLPDCSDLDVSDRDLNDSEAAAAAAFTPVAEPPPGEAGQLPGLSQSISVEYVMSSEESVASFHGQKLASFVPSFFAHALVASFVSSFFARAVVASWLRQCFTLQWDGGHGGVAGDFRHGYQFGGGCGGRTPQQERKKGVPWTEEEHKLFLLGLNKYGKGDWRNISRNFVQTRTPTQVASHAQKYFIRLSSGGGKDKRRSSIHDITTVHLTDDP